MQELERGKGGKMNSKTARENTTRVYPLERVPSIRSTVRALNEH